MLKYVLKRIKYFFISKSGKSIFWPRFREQFYVFQQDRLRGSEVEIKKRQEIYLKFVKGNSKKSLKQYSFLDCGFGRGEFLNILKENKIPNIIGVDTNEHFVKKMQKRGFEVICSDILEYLYLSTRKYQGISAFHLIEHLTFPQLFDFLVMCNKKLVKNGILILETPNTENINVSSTTFYYDHTHIQKLPKVFLQSILKFIGFSKIEFLYLHPIKSEITTDIDGKIFGPQDLGVIAYK